MRKHKTAIVIAIFLFVIVIITGLNLYFLLENMNTRDDRVRKSVEQVLASAKQVGIVEHVQPVPPTHVPAKGVDYFDGKDGASIKGDKGDAGQSIKGDKGDAGTNGTNGIDGLTIDIRCNVTKNRWETRYVGDSNWKIMGSEAVKCTVEDKEN